MTEGDGYIAALFDRLDGERRDDLEMARRCARLSKPRMLPDETFAKENAARRSRGEDAIPQNYQSLGGRMLGSLKGHMLQNGFPSESPWVSLEIPGPQMYDPRIPDEWKNRGQRDLFMAQLILMSVLESAPLDKDTRRSSLRNSTGFRPSMSRVMDNGIGTGDALLYLRPDFRIRTYRRDWYVTKRDTSGDVVCHAIKEMKDPLELDEDQFAKTGLNQAELEEKSATDRLMPLYTYPEWQPLTWTWTIKQEMNGNIINEFDEPITPFISAPFDLSDGEDYGSGFIEQNYGDLSTLDRLDEACMDYAAINSKMHPIRDISSLVRDKDFTAKTGTPITCRVSNGQQQDIGFLKVDKLGDFSIVKDVRDSKRRDLGAAALLESEAAPKGEAGRHSTAWKMVYGELQRVTGGQYASFIENIQLGLVRRGIYQLQQKIDGKPGMVAGFNLSRMRVHVLTGIAAMERDSKKGKLLQLAQVIQALGPEAQARIDPEVFVDVWMRLDNIYEPGLVKSAEKVRQEMAAAVQMQARAEANKKAIEVVGNVAEQAMLPQAA